MTNFLSNQTHGAEKLYSAQSSYGENLKGIGSYTPIFSSLITCDVIFGNPRDLCNGAGICKIVDRRIDSFTRPKGSRCDWAPAFMRINQPAGWVELILWKGMLCPNLYRKHLRQGILQLEEACLLPDTLTPGSCRLLPGAYPIQSSDKNFFIQISFASAQ